jgi:tetratricopeptide (TPR) repeat protein
MRLNFLYPAVLLASCAALLYGNFLSNPLVFDDMYFFLAGEPEKFVAAGPQFSLRWWVYYSLGLTFVHLGPELIWFRLGNLLLHIAAALALYAFIRRMLVDLGGCRPGKLSPTWAALLSALLFVLHPVAVFGAGYLIERTIVVATLFAILTWLSFWKGLQGSRGWLWVSVAFYLLAVFSKEHAIMAPAVCAALAVLHRRSGIPSFIRIKELAGVFGAYGLIALQVLLMAKGYIGSTYELNAPEMLAAMPEVPKDQAYLLSVLTQAGLFFKYLLLWALPNGLWMSADMREPFVMSWATPLPWVMLAAFLAYPVAAARLLWRGGERGMIGLALLAPWLLFATELSTVRLQEIFVLYRSYLWAPPLFLMLALAIGRLTKNGAIMLGALLSVAFFALSFDQLTNFSHPYLLWNDAARLAEPKAGQPGVTGLERIYHNRGLALHRAGFATKAVEDYDRALAIEPDNGFVHNDRGAARFDLKDFQGALEDFDQAIRLNPGYIRPYAGRARTLKFMGRHFEATEAFRIACHKGWAEACREYSK